mmetsp:Transcript_29798/g.71684  ORF Transcript_29798/g.71684 Transcript_29798/m.71684 type:complete len:90 (-) Transcript_29798:123-392(-)
MRCFCSAIRESIQEAAGFSPRVNTTRPKISLSQSVSNLTFYARCVDSSLRHAISRLWNQSMAGFIKMPMATLRQSSDMQLNDIEHGESG